MKDKIRNSNIELLRIISMIFILFNHYSSHLGICKNLVNNTINKIILNCTSLGRIGVCIFVMITGYFLYKSDNVKLKKLIKIIFQTLFYSIIGYLIYSLIINNNFSLKMFIKRLFVLILDGKSYWFVKCYLFLYILHPYINRVINSFNKNEFIKYLVVLIVLFLLIPTLLKQNLYFNDLISFIIYYSLGAYFNKYNSIFDNKKNNIIILISSLLLVFSSVILIIIFNINYFKPTYFINNGFSFFVIIIASCIFNLFKNMNIKNNKLINIISSTTFGIYLIHTCKNINDYLWINVLKTNLFYESSFMFIHEILSVIVLFIFCSLIELIRLYLIEKPLFKRIDKYIDKIELRIKC